MKAQDTIFITGGSSGIGLALAQVCRARGATVIIGGRNPDALEQAARACPGLDFVVMDVADREAVARGAAELAQKYPKLNTLINNAGIQRLHDFSAETQPDEPAIDEEIDINLRGLISVTRALLPLLRRQPAAQIVNVSSGLGFVPLVQAPVYSATKAAVHAFTVALREQLRPTGVRVVELIPPLVETNLHRSSGRRPPGAMTMNAFLREAVAGLNSGREEVAVGRARVLRLGARIAPGRMLRIINRGR